MSNSQIKDTKQSQIKPDNMQVDIRPIFPDKIYYPDPEECRLPKPCPKCNKMIVSVFLHKCDNPKGKSSLFY